MKGGILRAINSLAKTLGLEGKFFIDVNVVYSVAHFNFYHVVETELLFKDKAKVLLISQFFSNW